MESISDISREFFAPGASDHVRRQVAKFLHGTVPAGIRHLATRSGSTCPNGGTLLLPGSRQSYACGTHLLRAEILAVSERPVRFHLPVAAKRMRRLFDPRGGAGRQDVLAAADVDAHSDGEDLSYEAWGANRKAGEKGGNPIKKLGETGQYSQGRWAGIEWL